jgi:imipenem/basic amino acid-specific outer membrane pore
MKFTKLSLAALAAISLASSAFAVDNVKVGGDIGLWYQTAKSNATNQPNLFSKDASSGDLVATLKATGDLTKKVGFGLTMNAATTLGLENHMVSSEALGSTSNTAQNGTLNTVAGTPVNNGLNGVAANPLWISEMFMTYKAGNTLAKIGRQELGTPLCYTETWSAAKNTFEAALLVNTDIPNTTLIAGYVARSNGSLLDGTSAGNATSSLANKADFVGFFSNAVNSKTAGIASMGGATQALVGPENTTDNGAFAVAMVNKSITGLTIHPVYYDVTRVGTAFWADLTYDAKVAKVEGIYTNLKADGSTGSAFTGVNDKSTSAYALKASGAVAGFNLGASYSKVDKGALNVWNFATYTNGTPTTKLYTAGAGGTATGYIAGLTDTTGWKLEASAKLPYDVTLGAYYNSFDVKTNDGVALPGTLGTRTKEFKPSSYALIADTKVDEINLHVAYVHEDKIDAADTKHDVVRVVASIKF